MWKVGMLRAFWRCCWPVTFSCVCQLQLCTCLRDLPLRRGIAAYSHWADTQLKKAAHYGRLCPDGLKWNIEASYLELKILAITVIVAAVKHTKTAAMSHSELAL